MRMANDIGPVKDAESAAIKADTRLPAGIRETRPSPSQYRPGQITLQVSTCNGHAGPIGPSAVAVWHRRSIKISRAAVRASLYDASSQTARAG